VFGCAVDKIDFDRIDFIELILIKIELSEKWYTFGYLYVEVIYKKNVVWLFCVKIDFCCVNDQNRFFFISMHLKYISFYFFLQISFPFLVSHVILCFIIKFNTKSFLPKIDYFKKKTIDKKLYIYFYVIY